MMPNSVLPSWVNPKSDDSSLCAPVVVAAAAAAAVAIATVGVDARLPSKPKPSAVTIATVLGTLPAAPAALAAAAAAAAAAANDNGCCPAIHSPWYRPHHYLHPKSPVWNYVGTRALQLATGKLSLGLVVVVPLMLLVVTVALLLLLLLLLPTEKRI